MLMFHECAGSCLKWCLGYQFQLLGFGLELWELQPLSQMVGKDSNTLKDSRRHKHNLLNIKYNIQTHKVYKIYVWGTWKNALYRFMRI